MAAAQQLDQARPRARLQTERRMKRRELWLALAFIVPGIALAVLFKLVPADPRLPSEPAGDAGLRRT